MSSIYSCDSTCPNYTHYKKVIKPWGNYEILYQEQGLKVKKITVIAGNRLSLQKHSRRKEYWTILSGKSTIHKGFYLHCLDSLEVSSGETVFIDIEEIHRIQAITDTVFIEIQKGDYLEEDDIVRLEDDYNR